MSSWIRPVTAATALAMVGLFDRTLRHWGSTSAELRSTLPGDDLVDGRYRATHATSIARPAAAVWPWLVQMGYHRGGWYSYRSLERMLGAGDFAEGGAQRIVPGLQHLVIGDMIALSAAGGPLVATLEVPRQLVLRFPMDLFTAGTSSATSSVVLDWTWAFVLVPTGVGCRLVVRVNAALTPRWLLPAFLLLTPIHFLMEHKMLRTIRVLAEHGAGSDTGVQ